MDLYGASTVLSLTLSADIAVCLILSIANGPVVLFISQLPYIFSHGYSGAQIVIADFKTDKAGWYTHASTMIYIMLNVLLSHFRAEMK